MPFFPHHHHHHHIPLQNPLKPHDDIFHPAHYPGLISQWPRPEPYYGTLKIIRAVPTTDHKMTAVQYADGRYDMIANGYVPEPGTVTNNGPKVLPIDDVRGDISNSEGMDALNYMFNNTDCGATF